MNPEDALPVYQRQVEPTLQRKHNEAYRDAVGLLRKVRALMVRLGREDAFASYLESVRLARLSQLAVDFERNRASA